MSDGSIDCQTREDGRRVAADGDHSVELVSPICQYQDIETIQEIVRALRDAGAFVNNSCGIHIHVNAAPFTASKLRNLVNIMTAKEDMIYRALQVQRDRENHYCKKIDPDFLEKLNRQRPQTMEALKNLWYRGRDGSLDTPFIGVDGFCSPVGAGWRSIVTSELGYRRDPFPR